MGQLGGWVGGAGQLGGWVGGAGHSCVGHRAWSTGHTGQLEVKLLCMWGGGGAWMQGDASLPRCYD